MHGLCPQESMPKETTESAPKTKKFNIVPIMPSTHKPNVFVCVCVFFLSFSLECAQSLHHVSCAPKAHFK